jgi:hypothetical protein
MRIQDRLLLGIFGLALTIPTGVATAAAGEGDGAYAVPGGLPGQEPAAPHHHKGLFGRRHCVECQRAYAKAHDGVDIPAPPAIESGAVMHAPPMASQGGSCPTCQGQGVVSGPVMTADAHAPGYAVVGGSVGTMAANDAPGYAVVGGMNGPGGDPTPIGVSRAGQAPYGDPRMAAMGGRPGGGQFDASVMPASAVPPAQVAMSNPKNESRYKVIAHILGVPKFGAHRRGEEDKERQKHASIAYDQANTKVVELPASMVYGKGDR